QGESSSDGKCIVPSITTGIADSTNEIGLLNTLGFPTVSFPGDGDPCGGWIELQNMMTGQGGSVDYVDLKLRIAGAGNSRASLPARTASPPAVRSVRPPRLFLGIHLFPLGTPDGVGQTAGGVPHLAFVQLLPLISAQTMRCLQEQYVTLPADVYSSF